MELNLHPRQTQAFLTEATELLYGGAAGGGKSHLMRAAAIAWCTDIPGLQVYIFRRVSDDLTKNHMEGPSGFPALLSEWIDAGHVKINYSKNSIEFWNGAKIHLCHCQYEKDRFKYQGAEIHVLMLDELTHFTDTIYRYLRGRCRMGALRVPERYRGRFPRVICGSNPGGIGHNWVKATFIDPAAPMKIVQQPKAEGGMRRQYIPAKLDDNPTLTETDPDYIERLEGLGNAELVRAMRDGDWDIVSGGMFDDLWHRDTHVLQPFEIPSSWHIDRGFDWGSSKPFSVVWFAESDGTTATLRDGTTRTFPRGTIFAIDEWYGWNGKPNEGCKMLAVDIATGIVDKEKGRPYKVAPGPADTSIFDTQNGMCIADDMQKKGVRWEKADKSPGSRKNGWEMIRKLMKQARTSDLPGFFVFDTCIHVIRTLPVLPRDQKDRDDVDTDAEDHAPDVVRYRCSAKRRVATVTPLRM
jgi:hypothetical protein